MFCPNKWISFREVFWTISKKVLDEGLIPNVPMFGGENFEYSWLFAQESSSIGVCTTDGVVVNASRILVSVEVSEDVNDLFNHSNEHVNLLAGTVGSSDKLHQDGEPSSEAKLRIAYGPFLYLPIVFPRDDFQKFIKNLEGVSDESPEHRDMSPRNLAGEIIADFDRSGPTTFEAIKVKLAPGLSVRGFRFAWDLAKMERPELAKPGRRSIEKKS